MLQNDKTFTDPIFNSVANIINEIKVADNNIKKTITKLPFCILIEETYESHTIMIVNHGKIREPAPRSRGTGGL